MELEKLKLQRETGQIILDQKKLDLEIAKQKTTSSLAKYEVEKTKADAEKNKSEADRLKQINKLLKNGFSKKEIITYFTN